MDFRPTSAKTSGEKNFGKSFIGSKEPPSNFMGTLWGSFLHSATFNGLKSRKTPLWILKSKKDATVKMIKDIQNVNIFHKTRTNGLYFG